MAIVVPKGNDNKFAFGEYPWPKELGNELAQECAKIGGDDAARAFWNEEDGRLTIRADSLEHLDYMVEYLAGRGYYPVGYELKEKLSYSALSGSKGVIGPFSDKVRHRLRTIYDLTKEQVAPPKEEQCMSMADGLRVVTARMWGAHVPT